MLDFLADISGRLDIYKLTDKLEGWWYGTISRI